jgi:hypothetical protein
LAARPFRARHRPYYFTRLISLLYRDLLSSRKSLDRLGFGWGHDSRWISFGQRPSSSDPARAIVLHFLPTYCLHLDSIERLWALMHENVTHNRDFKTFRAFRREIITFLRYEVPRHWKRFRDRITDNFRVIHRADFRLAGVHG